MNTHEAIEALNRKDEAYREMLRIAAAQLHDAAEAHAALQARYDALKDEHRRLLAATCAE